MKSFQQRRKKKQEKFRFQLRILTTSSPFIFVKPNLNFFSKGKYFKLKKSFYNTSSYMKKIKFYEKFKYARMTTSQSVEAI